MGRYGVSDHRYKQGDGLRVEFAEIEGQDLFDKVRLVKPDVYYLSGHKSFHNILGVTVFPDRHLTLLCHRVPRVPEITLLTPLNSKLTYKL